MEKFARKCAITSEGMNEGFCFFDGAFYIKYEEHAIKFCKEKGFKHMTEAYEAGAYYHTTWQMEEGEIYYDALGEEYPYEVDLKAKDIKPRFKVLADYPLSNKEIGQIIEGENTYFIDGAAGAKGSMSDYPALFKRLEWWQERDMKNFSPYFQNLATNRVYKAKSFSYEGFDIWDHRGFNNRQFVKYCHVRPLTEEQYEHLEKLQDAQ